MPAELNSVLGSSAGMRGALSMTRWSLAAKKARKRRRISAPVTRSVSLPATLFHPGSPSPTRGGDSRSGGLVRDVLPQLLQRGALQAGDVHLADAQALGDLGLGHLLEEPHDHDPPLALVEVLHRALQHLPHLHPVQVRVLGAHRLAELAAALRAAADRRVDRHRRQGRAHLHRLQHVVRLHPEALRDLRNRRLAVELVLELLVGPHDLLVQLLEPPREADRPALVAEVATDLAQDRRRGERRELVAEIRIEAVDRLDQAQEADLDDVLQRLAAVLEPPRQEVDQALVAAHEPFADAIALARVVRLRIAPMQAPQLLPLRRHRRGRGDLGLRLTQLTRYFTIRYLI